MDVFQIIYPLLSYFLPTLSPLFYYALKKRIGNDRLNLCGLAGILSAPVFVYFVKLILTLMLDLMRTFETMGA